MQKYHYKAARTLLYDEKIDDINSSRQLKAQQSLQKRCSGKQNPRSVLFKDTPSLPPPTPNPQQEKERERKSISNITDKRGQMQTQHSWNGNSEKTLL